MSIFTNLEHHLAAILKANDFTVTVTDKDWTDPEWSKMITAKTGKVEINLVKNTLVLHVHQPKKGVIQDIIFHILSHDPAEQTIETVMVKPGKASRFEYEFANGKLIDHQMTLDYHSSADVVHKLTLEFETVSLNTTAVQTTSVSVKKTTTGNTTTTSTPVTSTPAPFTATVS